MDLQSFAPPKAGNRLQILSPGRVLHTPRTPPVKASISAVQLSRLRNGQATNPRVSSTEQDRHHPAHAGRVPASKHGRKEGGPLGLGTLRATRLPWASRSQPRAPADGPCPVSGASARRKQRKPDRALPQQQPAGGCRPRMAHRERSPALAGPARDVRSTDCGSTLAWERHQ